MLRNLCWLEWLLLGSILAVAAYFRWTGLDWDSGYLFHPDERQILLVISNLHLPANLLEIFTPASSLNPKFFAYGSFPIYLLRALAPFSPPTSIVGPWADEQLTRWVLLGRWLSGLFDLGTIVLTYALGKQIYNVRVGLLAAACVAVTVLHIQLSHFYAVDTLLTFFTLATLYCAFRVAAETISSEKTNNEASSKNRNFRWLVLTGICFGLAMATKITAAPLAFPIVYVCYRITLRAPFRFSRAHLLEISRAGRRPLLQIVGIALIVFVATQPYVLIDWYTFGRDVIRETFVARGWLDYPYTRQYVGTLPFVYQVTQGAVWGMGLPLGLSAWAGGVWFFVQWWKTRAWRDAFLVSFVLLYALTIGLQYTKYLRYLLPLLPLLYIMAASALGQLFSARGKVYAVLVSLVLVSALLYAFAFIQIYSQEHPWLTASRWIYQNVPLGKTLLVEQWDDALPTLIRDGHGDRRGSEYTQIALPVYDEDNAEKRAKFVDELSHADVVVLASQRLYGSIGRLSSRYPMTNRYYEKLFNGELGFVPVITTRNDPHLGNFVVRDNPFAGLPFNVSQVNSLLDEKGRQIWSWGFADESYSVYDHPQPILFQKVRIFSAAELDELLR